MAGKKLKIAVAGAGIAGLAAAAFLKQAGRAVTIFEKAGSLRPTGAGLLLQPTGLACLARLGLDEKATAEGARIIRLYGENRNKKVVFDLSHKDLAPDLYSVGIHRRSLFEALRQKTAELDIPVITGFSAEQLQREGPEIRLAGETGNLSALFDIAVDASGMNSALREKTGGLPAPR